MQGDEETRLALTVSRKWLISMSWEPAVPDVRLTAQPKVWLVTSAMGSARACLNVLARYVPDESQHGSDMLHDVSTRLSMLSSFHSPSGHATGSAQDWQWAEWS
jgi:hypothetical protein